MSAEEATAATRRPESLRALFLAFTWLALQGFGGVLAVAQRELVEKHRWLTREDFVETLAIAQVLPGPNIVNISLMLGDRFFGLRGAFVAMAGMLLAPSVIVLALAVLYGHLATHPVVVDALRGMGIVAAGLILATGVKLLSSLKKNPIGRWPSLLLAALTVAAMVWLKIPLPWLVLVLGGAGMALAWRKV
ncbi:chromate transporter [Paucibacter sp. R3-3]|uniref:Chromate transporter n=1 Tax=Roseateles agri TaxID=3098619 RepID=A0ABU5DKS8_9BURK|nr:chromate transporter [Paucibacter sp. R3-3]MDY0746295.1 chromate transporter [Paucibacter sp. R3-3]